MNSVSWRAQRSHGAGGIIPEQAYVVTMAPEVEGRIVELPVADNQFVHKGDLLVVIDPRNYKIAVSLNEAAVKQAQVNAENAERVAKRRLALSDLAVTIEQQQTYQTRAMADQAQLQQAQANLDQARVNLERTEIRSPVNGYVTNLLAQRGDYASVGTNVISLVDADSYWVDGYFEETNLAPIQVGDPASVKLMGYSQIVRGHVGSIARGINVANAQPNGQGLANVNPIFTWVRLAQRIPVRIHIDEVPAGVTLAAGMTATVEIDDRARPAVAGNRRGALADLAPTADPTLARSAVAAALGTETDPADPLGCLVCALRDKRMLLVLDNSAHRPAPASMALRERGEARVQH